MVFLDREREKKEIKAILSGEPDLVYFVYGPINSGKTVLLNKVFEELSEDYRVFYINFRGFEGGYGKFTRALFRVGENRLWETLRKSLGVLQGAFEYVERVAQKFNNKIELPVEVINRLHLGGDDTGKVDLFEYLENLMKRFVGRGYRPVLVFDELQVIRDEINASGGPLLSRLFNFLVRMTKETHLCHSLCATSDCLFVEEVYSSARLEGRAEYVLVDDLDRERAFEVYEGFGIEDRELVWEYVGGKFGDIKRVLSFKKRGYGEGEAVRILLRQEVERLFWIRMARLGEEEREGVWDFLKVFKDSEVLRREDIEERFKDMLYWVSENVVFYNPLTGEVRPQGRLIWHAIREVI